MHGFFSLGTLCGALIGIAATLAKVPIIIHLASASIVVVAVVGVSIRLLPADAGVSTEKPRSSGSGDSRRSVFRDRNLIHIGEVILAMALAEGTASDWSPLVLVDGHGLDATTSSDIYAGFTATMALCRFIGGRFVDRFGRAWAVSDSAAFDVLGIGMVALIDYLPFAIFGALLWGLGAALGFPVALSAAVASGENPAARISSSATIGYLAFLVGPPALGLLGEQFGLRSALLAVPALVVMAGFATPQRSRLAPSPLMKTRF